MTKRAALVALICLAALFGKPLAASAAPYNLAALFANIGFESGLTGWTYSNPPPNANNYLTNAEWTAQSWASSSPFPGYTDAQLATYYPGQPWGLNPDIKHEEQAGGLSDPDAVIGAAVGNNFVGSRQDGYSGHYLTGGGPSTPASYYDTNFQISYTLNTKFFNLDTFSLTTWGNRGRLNDDWGQPNASSDGSASTLTFRLAGVTNGPDYSALCTFSNWGVDGAWASQNCSWTLDRNVDNLTLVVTGQNKNHDRYVAVDFGPNTTTNGAVPEPASLMLLGSGLVGVATRVRRRRAAKGKA